jgi:hypothetical protein
MQPSLATRSGHAFVGTPMVQEVDDANECHWRQCPSHFRGTRAITICATAMSASQPREPQDIGKGQIPSAGHIGSLPLGLAGREKLFMLRCGFSNNLVMV